jgi:hypothetical protein
MITPLSGSIPDPAIPFEAACRKRLAAALGLAIRGDESSLAPTLQLLQVKGECGDWLRWECYVHEDEGNRVLHYLAQTLGHSAKLPKLAHIDKIPITSVILLARVVSRTNDEQAMKELVMAYTQHPDAENETTEMAVGVPPKLRDWVVRLAQLQPQNARNKAALLLAKEIVGLQCGGAPPENISMIEALQQCK